MMEIFVIGLLYVLCLLVGWKLAELHDQLDASTKAGRFKIVLSTLIAFAALIFIAFGIIWILT